MRRSVLTCIALTALTGVVGANGRPAATSSINFQQKDPTHILAGLTFGLVRSDDSGVTWKWMCEKAVGYAGTYDPDYAYASTGAIFATTFDGLTALRPASEGGDSCTFASEPSGSVFVSAVEAGSGSVFYAAADPTDSQVYKSTDDGVTFPLSSSVGQNNDWWDSMMISADGVRTYVTGYRYNKRCSSDSQSKAGMACTADVDCAPPTTAKCNAVKQFLLYYTDTGTTYLPMVMTGIKTSNTSVIDVVGIDHANKDIVYVKATLENGMIGDGIYKSTDKGQTWTKILTTMDNFGLSFVVKQDGVMIASTLTSGSQISNAKAACTNATTCAWTPLAGAPHINCLTENPNTDEVWACTRNFDSPGIPMDGYGIMKLDATNTAWTGVMHYQDIKGVVACPAGTAQHDKCVQSYKGMPSVWCCLREQLGITDTSIDCTGANSCDISGDGASDAGNTMVTPPKGCCNTGGSGAGALFLALGTGALVWRRRKK